MTATNRQRKGEGCSGTIPQSYHNAKEGNSDFTTRWKTTVLIFELFKQTAFIDVDNDSHGSDNCGKRDKLIIRNNTLLGQMFVGTMLCNWSVKAKILSNFVGFALI